MHHHRLSRDTFEILESTFGTKEKAEIIAYNLEEFLDQIDEKAGKAIVDRLETIRLQIKNDLSETLVTKELFEERFNSTDEKFKSIGERFNSTDEKFKSVEERFNSTDEKFKSIDERFKSIEIRFNSIDDKFIAVDNRFKSLEENLEIRFSSVDVKFKSLNFKFNILIALTIAALTLANPTFVKLLSKIF